MTEEPAWASALAAANAPGLESLRRYLADGQAVAFLGAGVSVPLYPLWTDVITELIDNATTRGLAAERAATCRRLARDRPDSVVEVLRRELGDIGYRAALRDTFRVRRDPETGRTWTPVHELVCRCPFRAVITTNYDPGIADARIRVRTHAVSTGFTTWTDELGLDRWRTGDVYGDAELPILYAHGHHNQPDTIVLATTEYRRAYAGKLARVLGKIIDDTHLVWIGFSFADQRIATILREVAQRAGTSASPGGERRHVAIMPWDPHGGDDPATLRALAEIEYGADLVLYPAPGDDHSALATLLTQETDDRFPAVPVLPLTAAVGPTAPAIDSRAPGTARAPVPAATPPADPVPIPTTWVPGVEDVSGFVGRVEELARLDRWAADPTVKLIGVSAWGGAGKTALVTRWIQNSGGAGRRTKVTGVFGWSFYSDPSPEHWVEALLEWANHQFGVQLWAPDGRTTPAAAVIALIRAQPIVLVLDGLEVVQEGPASDAYGRLLDGSLRDVLTAACRREHGSLLVLTSRFPFADVAIFDGTTARMLDVPPFTPTEGAALLAAAAPDAPLSEPQRRELVEQVDGHALAVSALAALLDQHPEPTVTDLPALLVGSGGTQAKVNRVLDFYSQQLSEADRYLVAAVALFARPVTAEQLLTVAGHEVFGGRLDGWDPLRIQSAAVGRLIGLLTRHPDGTITAHPLVRQAFRPLALGAAEIAVDTTLADTPMGEVSDRSQALRVVEAIELLIDADQWDAADGLHQARGNNGQAWLNLPAARLGQRAALAFVGTHARREACANRLPRRSLGHLLNEAGLLATEAGDLSTALEYLNAGIGAFSDVGDDSNAALAKMNFAICLGQLGQTRGASEAAENAVTRSMASGNRFAIQASRSCHGWVANLAGETRQVEQRFLTADRVLHADDPDGDHLYSSGGTWWAKFLSGTNRSGPARRLTLANIAICERFGWNAGRARCLVQLARLDLVDGHQDTALAHVTAALQIFRDGDYLVELADALTVAADQARRVGEHDVAADQLTEVLAITVPRGLIPIQATALAMRAHLAADRYTATDDAAFLEQGRDAADAAIRLTTGPNPLPWHHLAALEALAHLDAAESITPSRWTTQADQLRAQLIPPGLDPDPLTTVENQVREQREREGDQRLRSD